jgi:hypothetical protein
MIQYRLREYRYGIKRGANVGGEDAPHEQEHRGEP